MQLKHILISVWFLVIYAISFAHHLTPHEYGFHSEHHPEVVNESEINYLNQYQNVCKKTTKFCIKHDNHCDDGLLEYFVCLLDDFNHPIHHCDIEHLYDNSQNFNQSLSTPYHLYAELTSYSLVYFKPCRNKINIQKNKLLLSNSSSSYSLRGPPFFIV